MMRNLGFIGLHKKKSVLSGEIEKKISGNINIPLEDILSDDTLIDEIQVKNKTLIKYLNKDKIKQMIDYIIKEPPSDSDHDKGYKFPWVCSQIFNIGDMNIMKYFLKTNKELEEEAKKNEEAETIEEEKNKDDENSFDEIIKENENKEKDEKGEINKDEEKNKINKKLNINEIAHQKEKENKIELLDYLLTFLSSDKEPNYVLCGYFASIIKTLLNMDQTVIIKYLYLENKEFIRKLIYHSYRQSISEILNKIVQYDSNEDKYNIEDMALIRMDILEGLFDKIDINMDNEKLDSISTLVKSLATDERLLSEMLNNRKIIDCLIERPFKNICLLSDNTNEELMINKRRNFNILIDIIICWLNSINSFDIDLPSTDDEDEGENEIVKNQNSENFNHTVLSYELFQVLSNLIKNNFNKNSNSVNKDDSGENKILQCYDEKPLVPLGVYRIKIVELLGNLFTYFKNIPQLYDKLLIDCKFFENAFNYLFEYELNNIYQEALLLLFKKFLNYSNDHPLLAEFLFTKLNLMDIIISHLKDTELSEKPEENESKDRFLYKSGNCTSRGYIAFLISLAYKINTIIGGDPLRINNTLSREGSISFITRTAPFVGKEEINEFYGMDEDELYEAVSNESREKTSKLNCAVKSMEKYLNDKWNEFFYDHIADKIKLYETKLYKEDKRDDTFHNPFILEDENVENNKQNNFGLGEDEDEDVLGKKMKKKNGADFLYEDNIDNDINMNNRFKMSMRLPRSNKNNTNNNNNAAKPQGKRGSWGSKQEKTKVVVDEVEDFIDSKNKDKDKNKNKDENNEEEENPIDKFKREQNNKEDNEEEENPIDKFKRKQKEEDDNEEENPLDKFKNKENNEEENPLDKFEREQNKNNDDDLYEEEEENPLDKFNRENKNKDKNNDLYEEEEENPLDKFNRENKNKDKNNDNNDDNIYEEEEENPLDKFNRENKNKNNDDNNNDNENIYEEEEENPLDKFNRENKK